MSIKYDLLRCDTVWSGGQIQMFESGMFPPSSGQKTVGCSKTQVTYTTRRHMPVDNISRPCIGVNSSSPSNLTRS
jgi:hypothetical protein